MTPDAGLAFALGIFVGVLLSIIGVAILVLTIPETPNRYTRPVPYPGTENRIPPPPSARPKRP